MPLQFVVQRIWPQPEQARRFRLITVAAFESLHDQTRLELRYVLIQGFVCDLVIEICHLGGAFLLRLQSSEDRGL